MKNAKRAIALLLALVMAISSFAMPASAATTLSYSLLQSETKVSNDSSHTVTIEINLDVPVEASGVGYKVSCDSALSVNIVAKNESACNINSTAHVSGTSNEKTLSWLEAASNNVNISDIGVIEVTVPANTEPGDYIININNIKIVKDWGMTTVVAETEPVTATITVEEPSAPPETDPPVETDDFELYYTLDSDANATDGYADYVMPTQNSVVATVYLKNNPAGAAYLQAFDLYLSHHEHLNYQSTGIRGIVTADDDQLTHIQFVADKSNEYGFKDGEDLELGTITFEIDPNVVHDANLNITLGANTNISVGNNRAANEEETGEEIGDTTSYKPTISETLKGAEVKKTYPVTYNLDGGTGTADEQTKLYNIPLTLHSNAPTKDGYTFKGWLGSDNVTYSAGQSYEVNAALELTAQWEATKHIVKIMNGNGTTENEIAHNETITVPAADTKVGHTFDKWVDADGNTYTVGQEIIVTKALTLTAEYNVNKYEIKFVDYDGTVLKTEEVAYGDTPTAPADPSREADAQYTYAFSGWDPAIVAVTGSATYTAQYSTTTNKYTIQFVDYNDNVLQTGEVEYGTVPAAPTNPSREDTAQFDYEFTGWSPAVVAVTGNATYKATYSESVRQYCITYIDEGTTSTSDMTDYNDTVTLLNAKGKTGYSFKGWKDAQGALHQPGEQWTITGAVTLSAYYEINQYTISFNTAGGTTIAGITKDYGADVGTVMDPTKTGYTFAGWDKEIPATMPAENVTITANWTANTYTVKFHPGQGSGTEYVQSFTYDEDKKALTENAFTAPSSSHVFAGWATTADDATNGVVTYNDKHAVQNLTSENGKVIDLYAVWKQDVFKINYTSIPADVDMDTDGLPGTYSSDKGETITAKPTVTGYTFTGWTVPDGITLTDGSVTIPEGHTGELTLTANFTINQYTITFDTVGGSSVGPITQDYNTEVAEPEEPTKEGYNFDKWVDDKGQEVTFPMDMPAKDVTIKATWTINQYTITFNTDGGSEVAPIKQDYNTAVTAPADPTKTGYTFAGWDKEIPATMPAENVTIKAQWTINQYTITFDTDGGSDVAAITQDYNTAVTAPAAPTKTGYTFAGWDTEIPATIPAENVTITAQWTINQYTITFDTDGGTAIEAITQDYNTAVTAPTAPTKTGYTFAGWDKTIPTTIPSENVTITAQWTINQYTITFADTGDTTIAPITQNFDTAVTAPAAPTKTGYTFAGWSPAVPEKMPAGNVTITAQWTINQYTITFVVPDGVAIDAMTYTIIDDKKLPTATPNDATMYSFDKWVVSYAADYPEAEQGWGEAGVKVDAGSPVTNRFGNVTLTATWKKTADLFIEEYKYAGDDQFLLRVKDNLGTGSVYQFNSTAMYHTTDANYLVNSGDSGVFYILIGGENLKKTAGGEYEVANNGSLVLTEDAYKLLKSGTGDRNGLPDSCDINGDGNVNIADANIVYQMTQYTGNYYPDLLDEQRLLADQNTSETDADNDHRASIADVHAIVDYINANP